MRKINPVDVRQDFDRSLIDLIAFYTTVKSGLSLDKDQSFLAENTVLTAATLWEGFVNDLFIAYINRDTSQFIVHLDNAFEADRTPKQMQIANRFVTVTYPAHMTVKMITSLLDEVGNNVTFASYGEMKKGAKKYLAGANATRVSGLSNPRGALVNLWIALRNHIAHRSERSFKAMNEALAAGALHGTGLKRGVRDVRYVGAYLKAKPAHNLPPRVEIILNEMRAIAAVL
ncbi:hypothetical protein GFM13_19335 [Rhizobium leguminosarum bv. viciae]|nr:hypothetical protein [Rhizobium leguminosarum bv. viciae]